MVGLEESEEHEYTQDVVHKFLEAKMGLNSVTVGQARRLGRKHIPMSKSRPILVTFQSQTDRSLVLSKRSVLAGSKVFINNDLTKEQMLAEKQLREVKKKLLQHPEYQGKKISVYRNKVWVDRSPITEDMLRFSQ